jgi:hypothetical protein
MLCVFCAGVAALPAGAVALAGAVCAHTRVENTIPLATEHAVKINKRLRVETVLITTPLPIWALEKSRR